MTLSSWWKLHQNFFQNHFLTFFLSTHYGSFSYSCTVWILHFLHGTTIKDMIYRNPRQAPCGTQPCLTSFIFNDAHLVFIRRGGHIKFQPFWRVFFRHRNFGGKLRLDCTPRTARVTGFGLWIQLWPLCILYTGSTRPQLPNHPPWVCVWVNQDV